MVSFVNPRHDADLQVECAVRGSNASAGTAQILHDANWNAWNTFDNPDRVVAKPLSIRVDGGKLQHDLLRMSVATVVPIR